MLHAILHPDAACIGHRPDAALGLWIIDTSNPNSWSTALKRLLGSSAADVTLVQETKVRANAIASATKKAFHLGWKATFGEAKT